VRISDVAPDGNGEIQVKGENVMLGYYKDAAATERSFTHDGWFKTGDLGHFGRHGALFLAGRIKNLIILPNGKNVSPEELEEVLQNHLPYVKELLVYETLDTGQGPEIAMVAYFDPEWLQKTGPERARAQLDEDVSRINRRLTTYKRIQDVQVRDTEFEKTATRKVKRDYPQKVAKTA
jgi:long-chain acyl-CoA synthetase